MQTSQETLDRARAFAIACGKGACHFSCIHYVFILVSRHVHFSWPIMSSVMSQLSVLVSINMMSTLQRWQRLKTSLDLFQMLYWCPTLTRWVLLVPVILKAAQSYSLGSGSILVRLTLMSWFLAYSGYHLAREGMSIPLTLYSWIRNDTWSSLHRVLQLEKTSIKLWSSAWTIPWDHWN